MRNMQYFTSLLVTQVSSGCLLYVTDTANRGSFLHELEVAHVTRDLVVIYLGRSGESLIENPLVSWASSKFFGTPFILASRDAEVKRSK